MTAITIRLIAAVLAAAPSHFAFFLDFNNDRRKPAAAVAAVAERLVGRLSAGAPGVGSRFIFQDIRRFLRDLRVCHGYILLGGVELNPIVEEASRLVNYQIILHL